jgi:cobalt-zinc-cadmium efflux system protein
MVEQAHGEGEASHRMLRGLALALCLSAVVLGVEGLGAFYSRSLALIVDAVHNVPDLFAFAVSYLSLLGIARGGPKEATFGAHRIEVFAAILNAFVILTAGILFAYPAVIGLVQGSTPFGPIDPAWILFAAVPTLALRGAAAFHLGRIPRAARDLNVRSVLVHLGCDIAITAALIADAVVLLVSPASVRVDAAAALVIAAILVYESVPIFQGGWEVLTERVPRGVSLPAVTRSIRSTPRVRGVHDLHIWSVCPTFVCMTAHISVDEMTVSECAHITQELRGKVEREFGIVHAVFECEGEARGAHPNIAEAGSSDASAR